MTGLVVNGHEWNHFNFGDWSLLESPHVGRIFAQKPFQVVAAQNNCLRTGRLRLTGRLGVFTGRPRILFGAHHHTIQLSCLMELLPDRLNSSTISQLLWGLKPSFFGLFPIVRSATGRS